MSNKPDPVEFELYTEMLDSNRKIKLYEKKYFRKTKSLIYFLFIVAAGIISVLFSFNMIGAIATVVSSSICISLFLFLLNLSKRIRSASIIGDSLILKNARRKPYVTTLNTVKHATTYNILSVQCTFLNYSLDGRRHKTILIGNPPGISISLDRFFIHAKNWSKNKNKRQTISRVL